MSAEPERGGGRLALAIYAAAGACAAAGFGTKLYEFTKSYLLRESSFALPPVAVYVMVAAGFGCMFLWSTLRGQFRNIEGPKRWMLEREKALDEGRLVRFEDEDEVEVEVGHGHGHDARSAT